MKTQLHRVVALLIAVLSSASLALAQAGTAAVRGTVADPQGRVIPQATVVLTNVANDSVRTQKTGPVGNFSFDLIPPGDYRVSAEATGFKKAELQAVHALKRGRTTAAESDPFQPVARGVVDDTLPILRPLIADMVKLLLETGMRPGELVIIRVCDIDMSWSVWLYRPASHKTARHGRERIVPIGSRGQEIIRRH